MKKNLPETSHEANTRATVEMRQNHYGKIEGALRSLELATYEQIADLLHMDRHQIGRRLGEMETAGIVFKPGTKWPTKSGRNAYQYTLKIAGKNTTKTTEKTLAGKTVSDFSKKIFKQISIF